MPTIYILDYDNDIVFALCKWFKMHGFEVKGFSTLEGLLSQLTLSKPDCILLDCLYGRIALTANICSTIQQVFHFDAAIILTSTNKLSATDMHACGATHFVIKPFDLLQLLEIIQDVFHHSVI